MDPQEHPDGAYSGGGVRGLLLALLLLLLLLPPLGELGTRRKGRRVALHDQRRRTLAGACIAGPVPAAA